MRARTPDDDRLRADERWLAAPPFADGVRGRAAAVVYPNTYHLGMSNLGLHRLIEIAGAHPRWTPLRAFLPAQEAREPREGRRRGLATFDLGVPLSEVDLWLVTLSYEEDYDNLARLLQLARLPLRASRRQREHPLVIAGGFAPTLNPEPLAPLVDGFLLGPAEVVLAPFLDRIDASLSRRGPAGTRDGLADVCDGLPGWYAPGPEPPTEPVRVAFGAPRFDGGSDGPLRIDSAAAEAPPRSLVLTEHTEFARRLLVAVGEGCPHACRFCAAGFARRPPRAFPLDPLAAAVDAGLAATPRIGLMGPAVADHPDLAALARRVAAAGGEVSTSSTDIRALLRTGRPVVGRTATLAPEAGTAALRRRINKPLSDGQILEAVRTCGEAGVARVRLYLQVGLPGEEDRDAEAIVELASRCRETLLAVGRDRGRASELVLSVNPFVPKAGTPFQWAPMADTAVLRRRLELLRSGVRRIGGVQLRTGGARVALRQAVLSLGDRDAADLLGGEGAGWWRRLVDWHGARGAFVHQEKGRDHRFAWDFLDRGVARSYLWREWERARGGEVTPACDVTQCRACGAC